MSWVYNFAWGVYPTTYIAESACHPTYAPGRLLHNITTAHLDQLRPGDLVFGRQRKRERKGPLPVRHVVLWTGFVVEFENATSPFFVDALLENVPHAHRNAYLDCIAHQRSLGRPVYVIADSNFAGPAYRPFCGAYLTNFSHARRILFAGSTRDKDWPLANSNAVAYWDADAKACVSTWALSTEHGHVYTPSDNRQQASHSHRAGHERQRPHHVRTHHQQHAWHRQY